MTRKKQEDPKGIQFVESSDWFALVTEDKSGTNPRQRIERVPLYHVKGDPNQLIHIRNLHVDRTGHITSDSVSSTKGLCGWETGILGMDKLPEPVLLPVTPSPYGYGLVQIKPVVLLEDVTCKVSYSYELRSTPGSRSF